jgi:hypothetical protein
MHKNDCFHEKNLGRLFEDNFLIYAGCYESPGNKFNHQ